MLDPCLQFPPRIAAGGEPPVRPYAAVYGHSFPDGFGATARRWADRRYKNIAHWNELPRGGHFAAWEQPDLFVEEVRTALAKMAL